MDRHGDRAGLHHEGRTGPLVRIQRKLTAQQYCDVLKNMAFPYLTGGQFPGNDYVFQQDRSPVHTAKEVEALFRQGMTVLTWPPQSPDLNIIENVWGRMKTALARQCLHGLSAESLWAVVQSEWDRLKRDPMLAKALYESLPAPMMAVSECKGDVTRY